MKNVYLSILVTSLLTLSGTSQAAVVDYVITFEQTYGPDSDLGLTTGTFSGESTSNSPVTALTVVAAHVDTAVGTWTGPDPGTQVVTWDSVAGAGFPNFVPIQPPYDPYIYGQVEKNVGTYAWFLFFSGNVPGEWEVQASWSGQQGVILGGGTYTIASAIVPIPAAVWLFGSGLLGLVGMARRKKAT